MLSLFQEVFCPNSKNLFYLLMEVKLKTNKIATIDIIKVTLKIALMNIIELSVFISNLFMFSKLSKMSITTRRTVPASSPD